MTTTARLAIPTLAPGMASKELHHNEALQVLDTLVAGAVEEPPRAAPPTTPQVGACYLVGGASTGEWAGRAGHIAAFTAGGWRFQAPVEGMTVLVRSSGVQAVYRPGGWELGVVRCDSVRIANQQVVGAQAAAIAGPSGGTVVDSQARTAVAAILSALRAHGLIAT